MGGLNGLGAFQVSDGPTDLEDPVISPSAQAELGECRFQEPLPFPAHVAELLELLCALPVTQTTSDLGMYIGI